MSNTEIFRAGRVIALILEDGRPHPGVVVEGSATVKDIMTVDGVHIDGIDSLELQLPLGGEFDGLIKEEVLRNNGR